ncbi:MAG: hypothetical protein ABMA13_12975 [Chthoniobacteraceae bacterium]
MHSPQGHRVGAGRASRLQGISPGVRLAHDPGFGYEGRYFMVCVTRVP